MAELKLAKLPDRTPTKITFTASAELNRALGQYAEMYRAAYGKAEPVAELIPFILESFLESDREFAKARKTGVSDANRQANGPSAARDSRVLLTTPSKET